VADLIRDFHAAVETGPAFVCNNNNNNNNNNNHDNVYGAVIMT